MMLFFSLLNLFVAAAGLLFAYFQLLSALLGSMVTLGAFAFQGLLFFAALAFLLKTGKTSWIALLFGLASLLALSTVGYLYYRNPLYDVTTDLQEPPKFLHPVYPFPVGKGGEYLEKHLQIERTYDPGLAAVQRLSHPSIQGLKAKASQAHVYAEVLKVVAQQLPDWKKLYDDPEKAHAEFEVPWSPYRFLDDMVIEVRPGVTEHDSQIEMRSRTRVLGSDFGRNVDRLEVLRVRLEIAMRPLEERTAKELAAKEREEAQAPQKPAGAAKP